MPYEHQKRVAREINARIPRCYGRSERNLPQHLLRMEVNARCLHGQPIEEAIREATTHIHTLYPDFVPNVVTPV
jgi:hypothetical protein